MSRIRLRPKYPDRFPEIYVGLDRPLQTYFIQVYRPESEYPKVDHEPIEFRAGWTRDEVVKRIEDFAADDERTREVLKALFLYLDPEDFVSPYLPEEATDG